LKPFEGLLKGAQVTTWLFPFNGDISGEAHGPSHKGDLEEALFGEPSELNGQIGQEHEDVVGALMITHKDHWT